MNSEETKEYISKVNDSYLKILQEDSKTEADDKKRLDEEHKDSVAEAYKEMLSEGGYKEFFNKKLKAYGVSSPDELGDEEKKKFFNEIDKEWKGKKEED